MDYIHSTTDSSAVLQLMSSSPGDNVTHDCLRACKMSLLVSLDRNNIDFCDYSSKVLATFEKKDEMMMVQAKISRLIDTVSSA